MSLLEGFLNFRLLICDLRAVSRGLKNTESDQVALKLSLLLDTIIDLVLEIRESFHLDLLVSVVFQFLTYLFDLLLMCLDFSLEFIIFFFELTGAT